MIVLSQREREHQMAELVIEACSLVASAKAVGSVRILAHGLPTDTVLRCYQEFARARHVRLCVDDAGVIVVRPEVHGEGDR
jgi:hypothetical protein